METVRRERERMDGDSEERASAWMETVKRERESAWMETVKKEWEWQ